MSIAAPLTAGRAGAIDLADIASADLIFDKSVHASKATTLYIKCLTGAVEVNVLNMHDRPTSSESTWHWAHIPAGSDQYFRADTNDLSKVHVRVVSADSTIDWCTVSQVSGPG